MDKKGSGICLELVKDVDSKFLREAHFLFKYCFRCRFDIEASLFIRDVSPVASIR